MSVINSSCVIEPQASGFDDAIAFLTKMRQDYNVSLNVAAATVIIAAQLEGGPSVVRAMHGVTTYMVDHPEPEPNSNRKGPRSREIQRRV